MMEKMLVQWREELSEELTCDILPFWMAFLGDGVHFAGRIDGRGKAHPEAGKGAVLIARMLWTFSAAYRMTGRPEYLHAAGKLRKFLALWLIDPVHGGVYWEIAPDGSPVCGKKQSYAIGFAVYGLSEYVRATGDPEALDEAALVLGEPQVTTDVGPVVEALAAAAVEGLRPDGSLIYEYDPQTERIDADRHWWVQAEAVVGFFNMYERTGDEAFLRRSHDAWQYIRTHLLDGGNGEWFWSVRADGSVNRDGVSNGCLQKTEIGKRTTMANYNILTEVPPISKQDSFVVFERRKSNFNFPIHIHSEYELNYIIGARGARRIVGDHVADIGDREMVLITGSNLEHAWMDGNLAPGAEIYEVTIQFSPELFQGSGLIDRKQFAPIKKMLQDAQHGIAFSEKTILQSESGIHQLINSTDNFNSILIFLSLLNQLAHDQAYTVLSHSHFSKLEDTYDSRRVRTIMEYLNSNYHRPVRLSEMAALVNMSEPSFSRFIKRRTGYNFIDCLNNIRISAASRRLIDEPANTIAEIAFKCGFNNLSNFNRIFKKYKGYTPHDFREYYDKKKIII